MSITKRKKAYPATVRAPDGKERTATFGRRLDAERWEANHKVALAQGRWVDPRLAAMTLGSFVDTAYRPT